jgi:Tol biopolymer transport system component
MVMPAEGGTPVALTDGSGFGAFPAWSPSGLQIAFQDERSGRSALWLRSRDSVGGPWRDPKPLTDFGCWWTDWSPDGRTLACMSPAARSLVLVSTQSSRVLRSDLLTLNHLSPRGTPRFGRDGKSLYVPAAHQDGRQGIWAIPLAGGPARLVVAFDDPVLTSPTPTYISLDGDRLFLAVADYESDIWVARLRW